MSFASPPEYAGVHRQRWIKKQRGYETWKRLIDCCGALIGLVLLAPLFAIVAIVMKLEEPRGSIFFRQVRIGKNGVPFRMVKFRSMIPGAEHVLGNLLERNEIAGKMFKMKEDPRVTRLGRLLRKTSVDELPQLWNVLRGEMSLVGPRPPLPREVEQYSELEKQRLAIVPGCTGLWQVSGRNSLSFEEMVELDLYYIRTRNLRLDALLILRTVREMLMSKNAY